jgi:DNA-binding winged helix-turn-helix (wHTH) protein
LQAVGSAIQQSQDPENVRLPNEFQLGEWQIRPALGRISAQGQEHKLEPRVMEVLVYLAEHQGEVISRDELERVVWRGALVSYDAVTGSIIKLRKALDDRARQPRYIETIPKKGYRLITAVKLPDADVSAPLDTGPAGDQSPEIPPAGGLGHVEDRAAALPAGRSVSGRWVSRLVVLVLVLAVGAWLMLANDAQQVVPPPNPEPAGPPIARGDALREPGR